VSDGDESGVSRVRRYAFEVALMLALAAGAWVAADLLVRTWPLGRLPAWDAAGNGWGAVELWAALADGRLGDFFVRLNAQDKWPFGFSLLMLPFVALGGGGFESATLLPALAFALVPALLVGLGWEIERDGRGLAAGLVAGALWLLSPLPGALATVALRETAGAALGVAALAAYPRARRLGSLAAWRLAAALLLVLLFTKYNYFLLMGMAIGLHAVLEASSERRRETARGIWRRVALDGWRSPLRWVAIVGAISLVALALGQNPGNFLYAGLVAATALLFSLQWKFLLRPGAALSRLPPVARGLVEMLIVPVWIWSLSPRPVHPRNVIAFLTNRPGDAPVASLDALSFYPRSLFGHYVVPGGLAWALVALVLVGLAALWRRGDTARALALAVAVGALALVLHPLKQDRFLATVAPLLFLLAAISAVRLATSALPRRGPARAATALVLASLYLYGVFVLASRNGALARLERDHRLLTAPAEMLPALTAAAFWAAQGGEGRVGFVGGLNEVSESAVRWEAWRGYGFDGRWTEPLRGLDGGSPPREIEARLARWLERERPQRIVALAPAPGSRWAGDADYRRYNSWQEVAVAKLRAAADWRAVVERSPAAGLELVVLERRAAAGR
jgi:hypothetical protein